MILNYHSDFGQYALQSDFGEPTAEVELLKMIKFIIKAEFDFSWPKPKPGPNKVITSAWSSSGQNIDFGRFIPSMFFLILWFLDVERYCSLNRMIPKFLNPLVGDLINQNRVFGL